MLKLPALIFALLALSLTPGTTALAQQTKHAKPTPVKPIKEVFEPSKKYDPALYGKVAVVQWNPTQSAPVGISKAQAEAFKMMNRKELERFIREAAGKGAELIVTPEFGVLGYPDIPELPDEEDEYRNRDDIGPYVETVPGPTTQYFSALAKELGVYLHVGFAEVDAKTDQYFNVVVAIDPAGKVVAKYRKINLFEMEEKFLSPGQTVSTYLSPFGVMGVAICADIYSSMPMDRFRAAQVDAIALSASWAQMNTGMRSFIAGAKWAGAAVLASNQHYFPDSGVVNADGSLQSHIRQSVGIAYGYLARKSTKATKQR